ncbi:MAG: outer membrane beta-barrel domain-containing protein [Halobacteriovoraceae bacterium]|nr:outer membrane beta-barrel domain-containing protein [Halobacteriovoraceae bacterium]
MKILMVGLPFLILFANHVYAEEEEVDMSDLEMRLEALNMPDNKPPKIVNTDKLYSFHNRYSPLSDRHEVSVLLGRNLNIDGFLNSNQLGASYRYHFTDRWGLVVNANKVFNEFSSSGDTLLSRDDILPDKDFLKFQADVAAEYNLFYGKFRFSMDQVFYFDQYVALGVGMAELSRGATWLATADVGLAFWMGTRGSFRLGIKNDFYEEQHLNGTTSFNHNLVAYLSAGYLIGDF